MCRLIVISLSQVTVFLVVDVVSGASEDISIIIHVGSKVVFAVCLIILWN